MTRNEIDQQFSKMKKVAENRAGMSEEERIRALAKELNTDPNALAQRIKFLEDLPENATFRIVEEGGKLKMVIDENENDREKK